MRGESQVQDGARRKAIAYVRSSKAGDGELDHGVTWQRHGINAFAAAAGYEVVGVYSEIASARGKNNLEKRPALMGALEAAKRLGAVLIVYDWTRLTRHEPDISTIHALLPAHRILSVEEEEDLARAAEAGRLARAQAQGDDISRATREGMAWKKLHEGIEYGNPEIRNLQPKGAAAAKAKASRLREAIADALVELGGLQHGLSNKAIAGELNGRGLRTAQNKEFNARTVAGPLRDAMQILSDREVAAQGGQDAASKTTVPGDGGGAPPGWGRF